MRNFLEFIPERGIGLSGLLDILNFGSGIGGRDLAELLERGESGRSIGLVGSFEGGDIIWKSGRGRRSDGTRIERRTKRDSGTEIDHSLHSDVG
jgi:hypothetical protein